MKKLWVLMMAFALYQKTAYEAGAENDEAKLWKQWKGCLTIMMQN